MSCGIRDHVPALAEGRLLDEASELGIDFHNDLGALTAGTLVYVSNWSTGASLPKVTKADADVAGRGATYVVRDAVADGRVGTLVRKMKPVVTSLDTSGAAVGDPVYLSDTAGGITLTAVGSGQVVGRVVTLSATVGKVAFDLEGAGAGGGASGTVFFDSTFRVVDEADDTKKVAIDAGSVTAGQTRTLAMADRNVNLDYAIQRGYVSITPAQIRALRATPIALVAAPGVGKYVEFVSAHLWLDFGTVAHDAPVNAGDDLGIRYTDGSGQLVASAEATGFINGASDQHRHVYATALGPATNSEITPVTNAALVLDNVGAAEYAGTGDSPLKVEVFYRIRALEPAA